MAANSKLAVSIHTLTVLGYRSPEFVSSDEVAASVNTNPVVIRRVLGALNKANLVESQLGKAGGTRLARSPSKITLYDIYLAVGGESAFALHEKPEKRQCVVSCQMKSLLLPVFEAVEHSVEKTLEKVTLADLLDQLKRLGKKK